MAEILVDFNPTSVSPKQFLVSFRKFIEQYELKQLASLLDLRTSEDQHCSFFVNFATLVEFDSALAFSLLNNFALLHPLLEEALLETQRTFIGRIPSLLKLKCHVRLYSLPPCSDNYKSSLQQLGVGLESQLVQLRGTVVRTGGVRMLELSRHYECQNARCRYQFSVFADLEDNGAIPQPKACPAQSEGGKRCGSVTLRELEDCREVVDFQEVRVQDLVDGLNPGTFPRSVTVLLTADLVDTAQPGDDVTIVGRVLRQWRGLSSGSRVGVGLSVLANNIYSQFSLRSHKGQKSRNDILASVPRVPHSNLGDFFQRFWAECRALSDSGERQWLYRERILSSVCPQLSGLYIAKLALLLALIGGSDRMSGEEAVKRRSEIHLLLVGDPGCGKSQLLKFAASLLPRSVLTTGGGTSGAGLTCSLTRERENGESGGGWNLEAGAMVLANGGVCCVDEFSAMRDEDRAAVLEAMEQQSVSIAKAGHVAKLHSKTTVLACCNPKGRYDPSQDVSTNTALSAPLLSRFDLVLLLLDDVQDLQRDKEVSTFLLKQHMVGSQASCLNVANCGSTEGEDNQKAPSALGRVWTSEMLSQYVQYLRNDATPLGMSVHGRLLLNRFYHRQRQSADRSASRSTTRLLESLVRVAEAHARLMFRRCVELEDAAIAVLCLAMSNPGSLSRFMRDGFDEDPREKQKRYEREALFLLHTSRESLLSVGEEAVSNECDKSDDS